MVVEALQEMVVVVDRAYRYRIANRAYLAYRGLERAQLIGKSLRDTLRPLDFENVVKPKLDEAFRGNVIKYECRDAWSGPREGYFSCLYFPLEGDAGIDRLAIILQDIT